MLAFERTLKQHLISYRTVKSFVDSGFFSMMYRDIVNKRDANFAASCTICLIFRLMDKRHTKHRVNGAFS